MAEIFIQRKDDTVLVDKMGNLSLARRELDKAIAHGNVKYALITNHFGSVEVEYHDPEYLTFLTIIAGKGPKIDKKISKDALSRLEKENPVLFNKYLDWIFERKLAIG